MYAIVDIAGQQLKVEKDQEVFVNRLEGKEGSSVSFDQVLLIDDNGKIKIGAPAISGASVQAKILSHDKGDKVIVFKKKRRKGYRVRNGHRSYLTKIQIEKILASGSKKAAATTAKEEPKKEAAKPKAKATEAKKTTSTAKKTDSAEKTTKKTTSKSTAAKTATKASTTKKSSSATAKKATATEKKAAKPKAASKTSTAKKTESKKTQPKKDDKE